MKVSSICSPKRQCLCFAGTRMAVEKDSGVLCYSPNAVLKMCAGTNGDTHDSQYCLTSRAGGEAIVSA